MSREPQNEGDIARSQSLEIAALRSSLQDLRTELDRREKALGRLTTTVDRHSGEISGLNDRIENKLDVDQLKLELTRLSREVSHLHGKVKQLDGETNHLSSVTIRDARSQNRTVTAYTRSENTPLSSSQSGTLCKVVVAGLSLACIVFSLWAVTIGWNNTIFDNHGFRQSQTAITTYYLRYGEFFSYETPILGPPWSIPFELPIYQSIVAATSKLLHLPLDQAGRLISVTFFYSTFFPLFVVLRIRGASSMAALVTLDLFAMSPFYLFWSRTFMIESTALFFAVSYLAFVAYATTHNRVIGIDGWMLAVGITLSGTLAALTKATTFASFLIAAMLLISHKLWNDWKAANLKASAIGLLVTSAFLVPVISSYCWTIHTDTVKGLNPMGSFLTSHMLERWNFGTLDQRLSLHSYTNFAFMGIGHVIDNLVGSRFVILLALALLMGLGLRSLRMFIVCVALYISAIAIFFNLHMIHSYYAYANGIFLIAAIGLCISAAFKAGVVRRWAAVCVLGVAICTCVVRYFHEYYQLQETNAPGRPLAAAVIDRETKPTDSILVYGLDWSSEFPYQARRRAIMAWKPPGEPALQHAIANLGISHISALIVCDNERSLSPTLLTNMRATGFSVRREFTADNCDIYLP